MVNSILAMLGIIWSSRLGRKIVAALGLLGAVLGALVAYGRAQRKRGAAEARDAGRVEAERRAQAGRRAAQDAQDRLRAGDSPQSIVDDNSKAWRRR